MIQSWLMQENEALHGTWDNYGDHNGEFVTADGQMHCDCMLAKTNGELRTLGIRFCTVKYLTDPNSPINRVH